MNIKENHKETNFEIYGRINSFNTVQLGDSVTFHIIFTKQMPTECGSVDFAFNIMVVPK